MLANTSGLNSTSYDAVCVEANVRQDFQSDLKVWAYSKLGRRMGSPANGAGFGASWSPCLCILNIWTDDLRWLKYGADGVVLTGSVALTRMKYGLRRTDYWTVQGTSRNSAY